MTILLWRDIIEVSNKVCRKFDLTYGKIEPCTSRRYHDFGEAAACDRCYNSEHINIAHCKEKIIKIRIHQLNRPNAPLKTSTILHTLAHELAHLRQWEHGKAHRAFTKEIIQFMQELGYDVLPHR